MQAPDLAAHGLEVAAGNDSIGQLQAALRKMADLRTEELDPLLAQISSISQQHDTVQNVLLALLHDKEKMESRRAARSRESRRGFSVRSPSRRPSLRPWTWKAENRVNRALEAGSATADQRGRLPRQPRAACGPSR